MSRPRDRGEQFEHDDAGMQIVLSPGLSVSGITQVSVHPDGACEIVLRIRPNLLREEVAVLQAKACFYAAELIANKQTEGISWLDARPGLPLLTVPVDFEARKVEIVLTPTVVHAVLNSVGEEDSI